MKPSTGNPAPGNKENPQHRITVEPAAVRVQVRFKGELIADTNAALEMHEGEYPAVYYVPRAHVK
ncbi:MAG: DUF427 domain-containing protein, partial [Burkholderiales bacterium]